MKSGTKTDTVEWNIPKNVQIVDETFIHGSTDLLVDADLLYESQCCGRKTRLGDYPVLQETTNSNMLKVLEIKCLYKQYEVSDYKRVCFVDEPLDTLYTCRLSYSLL
jgi:hypothetical protein